MKERPILFNGPMVKAILDGRKTQTRRIVKPQPQTDHVYIMPDGTLPGVFKNGYTEAKQIGDKIFLSCRAGWMRCPYGMGGDRLWVRETWGLCDTEPKDGPENAQIFYKATDESRRDMRYQKWRPSIHMPRWASRINLEITGIGIQRIQDISREDAREEGVTTNPYPTKTYQDWDDPGVHVVLFSQLWDSVYAGTEGSWDSNPWVWIIEFRRIK